MPSVEIAVNIAKALGVTVEYLIAGEETDLKKPQYPNNQKNRLKPKPQAA